MNTRVTSFAVALAINFGAAAMPNLAQAETFNAWGHEFNVPGSPSDTGIVTSPSTYTAMHTDADGNSEPVSARRTGSKQGREATHRTTPR